LGRPTEMSLRDLLIEELKRRGVVVIPEVSFRTVDGRRLMPDLVLKNGAEYVVETKLGAETKLLDAMVQLYEYSKHVVEAKGAFAVLFPAELRRPWPSDVIMSIARDAKTEISCIGIFKDLRPSQPFKGNLFEVADWIAGHVLKAPVVEADTGFAIRILRDAVDYVTASIKQLQSEELEDIFGGKSVFENVLQYEEGKYPLEEMRRAATYLLVNQLLFYHVLTRMDASFPIIDEDRIKHPADLRAYFEPVLRRNYSSVFGFDVASRLPESATEAVKKTIIAVKALAPEKIRHDLLGKVFHELIPFEIRKAVAAFYTNNEAAEILAQLAIEKADAKVIDLACGSGTLLVAAYRRKRELLQKEKGMFTLEDHKRFLEEDLTGIDIMPFAAHMAVVHLSLQALAAGHETERVRIAVWDSTELEPGQTIPAISRELKDAYKRPTLELFMEGKPNKEKAYIEKGTVSLEGMGGEQISLEQADLVIMNPPFTRQERLPKDYKSALMKRLANYKELLHGQVGLYGYFVLLADKFTKSDGRMALVLPASVLRIQSLERIRKFLVKKYQIEYIITTWQRAAFSEGAQFREVLLIAKKLTERQKSYDYTCRIVKLKNLPTTMEQVTELTNKIKRFGQTSHLGTVFDDKGVTIKVVSVQELNRNYKNLFKYIASWEKEIEECWSKVVEKAGTTITPLAKVLKDIGGRIFEGARARSQMIHAPIGSLFILKDFARANKREDLWIIKDESETAITAENLFTHSSLSIPKKSLRFGLRRLSGVNIIDLSEKLDFIVVDLFEDWKSYFFKEKTPRLKQEIRKWRNYIEERLARLTVAFRFDMSAKGTTLFAWFSSKPMVGCGVVWNMQGVSKDYAKILSLWFNSTVYVLQIYLNRVETRGAWMQFHKYVMDDLLTLHPLKITENQKKMLLKTFEKVKDVEFPAFFKQLKNKFWARVEIDKAILKTLGFSEQETTQLLDYLYPALTKEIEQLKVLMKG